VFYNGIWRSVCHDGFDHATARVVCNMLGFGYAGRPTRNIFGYGHGPFWWNSVWCTGKEKSISECSNNGWGIDYCRSNEEQAVSCLTDDAVALFGGGNPREGRIEVYRNGTWGTVCDDGFTDAAAIVICYSLGFGYVGRKTNVDIYGVGKGEIWIDDINCGGTERHIGECSHRGWGVHDCTHAEDVAVSCVVDSPVTTTTSPTSTVNSTASFQSANQFVVIFPAAVAGGLILCCVCVGIIGMTCCRRNRVRGISRQPSLIPPRVTSSDTIRLPPTAPAVWDDEPPTYEESMNL